MKYEVCKGNYNRMGIGRNGTTTTFSIINKTGKACFLLLYPRDKGEVVRIPMQKDKENQTFVYSVGLKNIAPDSYTYRYEIDGKSFLDPYAERITGREVWGDITRRKTDVNCGVRKAERFDWKADRLPQIAKQDMVMYKLHVRGFSMLQKISRKEKGTFKGIERKISYLKELGVTTLELMPIYEFEEMFAQDEFQKEIFPEEKINYWGYTRGNYLALKSSYLGEGNTPKKFKQFVQKLHQNGMECILEFYFDDQLNSHYILDVLRYWAHEYHIDGFHVICSRKMAELIAQDRCLSGRKLFFEWFCDEICRDAIREMELFSYNDGFLYAVRKFINQQGGSIQEFANNIKRQHKSQGFVNYLAVNNGFCLYDSFSYIEKRNQENGEGNQDGISWNCSSNCGEEGPSKKRYVNQQRARRIKNALCALAFAQGVPLIWMGDECGNTQNGNNNPYCQDNETGWKNWDNHKRGKEIYSFLKRLLELRKKYSALRNPLPMEMNDYKGVGYPDLSYHGESGWKLEAGNNDKMIGMMYSNAYEKQDSYIYIGYNFSAVEQRLALPTLPKKYHWFYALNTEAEFITEEQQVEEEEKTFVIQGYSVCVLIGKVTEQEEEPKGSRRRKKVVELKRPEEQECEKRTEELKGSKEKMEEGPKQSEEQERVEIEKEHKFTDETAKVEV